MTTITMVYAILTANSHFFFTYICQSLMFCLVNLLLFFYICSFDNEDLSSFLFFSLTHGFVIVIVCYCVNLLLLVKFIKTDKIVLLSQFELKFSKDQKCRLVLWCLVLTWLKIILIVSSWKILLSHKQPAVNWPHFKWIRIALWIVFILVSLYEKKKRQKNNIYKQQHLSWTS